MSINCDELRRSNEYAGLSDKEIELQFYKLHEVSTQALIRALEDRGIDVELHLFDRKKLHEVSTQALIRALEDRGIDVELHLFDRTYRNTP